MLHNAYKKALFLAIFLLLALSIFAQKATLQGSVIDDRDGAPLFPATIKVGETGTITDFDGKFEISIAAGVIKVEVSYVGYETITQEINIANGEIKEIEFSLKEAVNLLQTATVTSGKYEKPLAETTVSLEVIKSDLLESTNARSLDQTLEKLPGVNLVGSQANIRGGSGFSYGAGSRVLLLVNDLPALQSDAGTSNWGDLPVESIEQVEVIKGAASALYGSAAMNGLINVRTSYARSEPETKLSLFGGIYDAPKDKTKKWWTDTRYEAGLLFSHKQKFNKLDLVLGGRYYNQKDPREHSDEEQGRLSLGLRYRLTDRLSVGFNSTYNKQDNQSYFYWLDANEGNYRAHPTTLSASQPTRFYIDPFISFYTKNGDHHKFNSRYFSIDNNSTTGTENFSDLYYGSYQFQKKVEPLDLVITAGVVAARTNVTAPLYSDTSYALTNNAAYLQIEKKLFDRVNLSAGIRYEYNKIQGPEQIGNFTIPGGKTTDSRPVMRFGANYQAGDNTFFRASWGQGFRFPTIAEKFITTDLGGTPISPNPELTSETGWSSEIGFKQGFKISNWNGFFDFASFWMEYQDMIEFVYTGFTTGFQANNIGNTVIKGIDASIQGQGQLFGINTNIIAGYTYIDPKFKVFTENDLLRSSADFNVLKYRFRHTVKVDIESKFDKFNIGIALFRNSHIEAIDAIFESLVVPGLKDYRTENNNGFYVFNARLGYQVNEHLKLGFLVNNLTNVEFTKRPGLLEPTRLWSMRIDYKF
jgi:iron complex outermembrane receptor protein